MGPATDKHQAPTHRLKLYVRAVIESEANIATTMVCGVILQHHQPHLCSEMTSGGSLRLRCGIYCTLKYKNKQAEYIPLDPQPQPDDVVKLH